MADAIALIGGETLLGREIRELLGETALGERLRLIASSEKETGEEETVTLTGIGESAAFLSKLDENALAVARIVILAGSAESAKRALESPTSATFIDLTGTAEDDPRARIRAPQIEDEDEFDQSGPQIVAHPAAIAIASLLKRLHESYPIVQSVVHVFEPASERGSQGIEELQQQAVNLLSFQPLPKKVFDAQAVFAMLAQFGSEAPLQLAEIEERIERHLASLLERLNGVPMPSLRLVQASVFHGYSFSLWVEFEGAPAASDIEESMRYDLFDLRTSDVEAPNNVGVAGQSSISVGAIAPDRNNGNAFWLWAAADNLRLAATAAALIAREAF